MKSEPDVWSIDQQQKAGIEGATWDGVRNYQAANNLKKMKPINSETVAKAMIRAANENLEKNIFESNEIAELF